MLMVGFQLKGKISRMLAAKAALAVRVDALGESTDAELGAEHRANLEARYVSAILLYIIYHCNIRL